MGGEIRLPIFCLVPAAPAATLVLSAKAITAIDRATVTGLERNHCVLAALRADRGEHLTGTSVEPAAAAAAAAKSCVATLITSCLTTCRAALWFICETFISVERLIVRTKIETLPTLLATKGPVLVSHR